MLGAQIMILAGLVLCSAFFSGAETALISLNKIRVSYLVKQKRPGSDALLRIKKNPHKLIITILIGNNVVNIAAASIATVIFTKMLGDSGIGVAAGIMTFFILVFGEIVPKTFAAQNAEKLALAVARPIEFISFVLTPFIWFFEHIATYVAKALGTKGEKTLSEEEIKVIVSIGKEEGILSPEVAKLMHNVLEFEKIRVNKIMTPRKQMIFVNGESTLEDSIDYFIKTDYSKYPVYLDHENCIAGVLYIDDLLKFVKTKNLSVKIKDIAVNAYFVPENKEIDDLLIEFEQKGIEIAIVVDEYGDVSGMVTMEDIIDEIVGDIFNKAKAESIYIKHIDEKSTQVEAIAPIREVNHVLKLDIKEEHFNTIAGFLIGKLGRIPKQGEQIKFHKAIIEVEKVTDQEIKSVKIIKH